MSRQVFVSTPPFIEIRCSEPVPFYFARRKGKDSIGVLLFNSLTGEVLIRYQPLVHLEDGDGKGTFPCPLTGSMELDESPETCALREVYEESGYTIYKEELISLGAYIVGTQTDEIVYLYAADVLNLEAEEPEGDGTFHEGISTNVWMSYDEALAVAEYSGLIIALFRLKARCYV
jgi:8-oxo-dGTP diphosphatase